MTGSDAPASDQRRDRFDKLEAVRGLAAMAVVLYHSPFATGSVLIARSYLFVDLFFLLSGFVMSHAYGRRIATGMPFTTYVRARLARLYPLHLATLLAWIPIVALKRATGEAVEAGPVSYSVIDFMANLLLVQAWGATADLSWNYPSWSISTEWAAYLAFFWWVSRRAAERSPFLPVSIGAAMLVGAALLHPIDFNITSGAALMRCVGGFMLGRGVYLLHQRCRCEPKFIGALELAAVVLAVAAVVGARSSAGVVAMVVPSFAIAVWVASRRTSGVIGRLLLAPAAQHLGRWSYSIYMVHSIVIAGVSWLCTMALGDSAASLTGAPAAVGNVVVLSLTVGIAAVSYAQIEVRGRQWVMQFGGTR